MVLRGEGATAKRAVIVRTPVAFNFVYRAPFSRARRRAASRRASAAGAVVRGPRAAAAAYRGDAAGFLPLYAAQQEAGMARQFPGLRLALDGRANINQQQGFEIVFQFRRPAAR